MFYDLIMFLLIENEAYASQHLKVYALPLREKKPRGYLKPLKTLLTLI